MSASRRTVGFRMIRHTADVALRVRGDSLEQLFCNAAAGMFAYMSAGTVEPGSVRREVVVEGDDNEALLVAWLSELVYLREVHGEVYSHFQVSLPAPGRMVGLAEGSRGRTVERPIKAVTYHGLAIERKGGRYQATIVFDV